VGIVLAAFAYRSGRGVHMEHFVLLLIALNAISAQLFTVNRAGSSHHSARSCLQAAAEAGPQRRSGERVRMFTCQTENGGDSGSAVDDGTEGLAPVRTDRLVISGDSREAYLSFR
jgi:hypothetical protein